MKKLLIVVIATPNSSRFLKLNEQLAYSDRIDLVYVPAVMYLKCNSNFSQDIDLEFMQSFYARSILDGEIGCSISHNLARGLIAENVSGGVILEDDARIIDMDRFIGTASKFLERTKESAILNLSTHKSVSDSYVDFLSQSLSCKYVKSIGPTPLALAYALSQQAALKLLKVNNPIRYLADWPKSSVSFFFSKFPSVAHGDFNVPSIIDPGGQRQSLARIGFNGDYFNFVGRYYPIKRLIFSKTISESLKDKMRKIHEFLYRLVNFKYIFFKVSSKFR
jgi:GR25 family glycosyltransferase involved in LPS biosynthesis